MGIPIDIETSIEPILDRKDLAQSLVKVHFESGHKASLTFTKYIFFNFILLLFLFSPVQGTIKIPLFNLSLDYGLALSTIFLLTAVYFLKFSIIAQYEDIIENKIRNLSNWDNELVYCAYPSAHRYFSDVAEFMGLNHRKFIIIGNIVFLLIIPGCFTYIILKNYFSILNIIQTLTGLILYAYTIFKIIIPFYKNDIVKKIEEEEKFKIKQKISTISSFLKEEHEKFEKTGASESDEREFIEKVADKIAKTIKAK